MRSVRIIPLLLCLLINNIAFANGDDTLHRSYQLTGTGVNYVEASGKSALRYTATPGNFPTPVNISGIPNDAVIEKAFLYFITGYKGTEPTAVTATMTDPSSASNTFPVTNIGKAGAKCWSETGNITFRADVTQYFTGNGTYTFESTTGGDATDGFTLLVVYRDTSAGYVGRIFIDDGIRIVATSKKIDYTVQFTGVPVSYNAKGFFLVSDNQSNINGDSVCYVNNVAHPTPRKFYSFENVPITLSSNQASVFFEVFFQSDCYSWAIAGIYYQTMDTSLKLKPPIDDTMLCEGDSFNVQYEVNFNFNAGNEFTAELSDANGSFLNPTVVGSVQAVASGTIPCVVPPGLSGGTGYKVRVRSSKPAMVTDVSEETLTIGVMAKDLTAESNTPICITETIKLTATSDVEGLNFKWTGPNGFMSSSQNPEILNSDTTAIGIYEVTAEKYGCKASDTTYMHIQKLPEAEIVKDLEEPVCTVDTIQLAAKQNEHMYTYKWQPENYFFTTTTREINGVMPVDDKIVLTVTDSLGCISYDTVSVTTKVCCDIFVPNAFTPNKDGKNDVFRIRPQDKADGQIEIKRFIVVNRFGEVVFQTDDPDEGWDGSYKNQILDLGTYWYYIKYTCGRDEILEKKGSVILIR